MTAASCVRPLAAPAAAWPAPPRPPGPGGKADAMSGRYNTYFHSTRRAHSLCTPAVTARAAPPRQHPSGTSRKQSPPIRPVRTVILSMRESSFSLVGPAQLQSSSSCTTAAECSCKSIRQWPCSIQASQMARVPQQRSCSKAPLEQLRHWRHAAKLNPSPSSLTGHGAGTAACSSPGRQESYRIHTYLRVS